MLSEDTPEVAGFHAGRIARISERAAEWLQRGPAKSLVLLAARNGVVALHDAYGVARYDSTAPLATDAVFWTSSMTKPVTATAVMMLVEDGAISLNRPLRDYFPEFDVEYAERILLHQLLTHTSGIGDDIELPTTPRTPCPEDRHPFIHAQLEAVFARELVKNPGEQNVYANSNYLLLGELVHRVSGQRLDEFTRAHLFEPLGMHSTSIGRTRVPEERFVDRDPALEMVQAFRDAPSGGAGLHTNARDIAVFAQMFLDGGTYGGVRILNEWTVAEMTRNQIPGVGTVGWGRVWVKEASWGLGWMIQGDARWRSSHGMLQPRGTYYHQGASGCAFWVDPLHRVVGVYLSSTPALDFDTGDAHWEFDTFQNMVTAAVRHGWRLPMGETSD